MELQQRRHWIARLIDNTQATKGLHPVTVSILIFGTPGNLFLLTILVTRGTEISTQFLFSTILGVAWLNFSGYLVWYYDARVVPEFYDRAEDIYLDTERLAEIYEEAEDLFSRPHIPAQITWTGLLVLLFFLTEDYLVSNGLFEAGSVIQYLFLGSVIYLGSMTAIGFMGVITTLYFFRQLSSLEIKIDPLHPDGLGGLSSVGYYAIRTTLTFTTGSTLLPLAFAFVRGSAPPELIYLIVFGFMIAIAASFIYPTYLVNRQAQKTRNRELKSLRSEYQEAKRKATNYAELESSESSRELVNRLELERIRREYQDYNSIRLYPFQVDIIFSLLTSIILPILFLLLESFIQ